MSFAEFPSDWEVYDAPLGTSVIVRHNGFFVGVVNDRTEALRLIIADIRLRDRLWDEGGWSMSLAA